MSELNRITRHEFKVLTIVVILAAGGLLGVDIHLASLPYIMKFMHTDKVHMQQSVSLFLLGTGLSMLLYGPMSDRFGRKPIVIFGLALATIASLAAVFSHSISYFLVLRLLQGLGSGVCIGLGRTIVADVMQGDRLAAIGSYFSMVLSLSPLLAPAVGGYIQHWFGWQENFVVLAFFLLASLFIFLFFCPETNQHKNPHAFTIKGLCHTYQTLLADKTYRICTLIAGLAIATTLVYATISSFMFQVEFHLSPIIYGWITAIVGVGSIIGKVFAPISIKRLGGIKTFKLGLFIMLSAAAWLVFFLLIKAINVPLIMAAVFIMMFGLTFAMPIAMSLALSPHHDKRGSASALYGSFQMLVAFVSSAIAAAIPHGGVVTLAVAYCTLSLFCMLLFGRIPK